MNRGLCDAVSDISMSKAFINLTLMSSYAVAGMRRCTSLVVSLKTLPSVHQHRSIP